MAKDQATIQGNQFFKSLGKLEALAKGSESETGEDMNKAQLFHTPSNSEKATWGNGDTTKYSNKWDDKIGADGTDYKAARKSIAEKVMKGEPLAPEEIAILKSDVEQGVEKSQEPHNMGYELNKSEKDADEPAKEEKAEKACPSMQKSFEENSTLKEALEMSSFLQEFAKAFGAGLGDIQERMDKSVSGAADSILKQVGDYMDARFAEQSEFNKSLADAVVNIGHGIAGAIGQQEEIANQPAGAPKSQMLPQNVQPLHKSFEGPAGGEQISKSQKLDVLSDMVQKGQLNSAEVVKFEVTNQIRPELDAQVTKMIQSGGQAQ